MIFDAVRDAALSLNATIASLDIQASDPPAVLKELSAQMAKTYGAIDAAIEYERDIEAALRDVRVDDPQRRTWYRRSDAFYGLLRAMREVTAWLGSSSGRLLSRRAYFLSGKAGSGKTHLLLDATRRALANGRPAVFLAGAQFGLGNLWASITDQLGLEPVGADVLLAAMDAAGEAATTFGSRFLVVIDALNETVPPTFWTHHLPALRSAIARYPHVALVVSCRDTYQDLVLEGGEGKHFQHRTHPGFADREIEATQLYFAHYGIEAPKIPLLIPEFTLPLFLRLYCESLGEPAANISHEGHQGRVAIFERYLAAKVTTIARRLNPDATSGFELDTARSQVTRVLNALLDEMARRGTESLPVVEAEAVVGKALEGTGLNAAKALGLLNDDGVLTRERLYFDGETHSEGVRIVFQAFADFLLLKRRLANSVDPLHDEELTDWLTNRCSLGICESATVLFPEVHGIELPDLLGIALREPAPQRDDEAGRRKRIRVQRIYRSLVEMLPYRASKSVTERTIALLNEATPLLSPTDMYRVLFTMAPQPRNRLNAERLHSNLARLTMPVRDSDFGFATYHEISDEASLATRLARWAAAGPYPDYDPVVVELASIPLCWLLSSPNRFMRDWVTKALTQLLHGHLDVMRVLVERFWSVDDPYIVQRVVAIAYGCLLRSSPAHATQATALARTVHTLVFTRPIRADELLLDAARGVIRWAIATTLLPESARAAAERPYGITAPSAPPTEETLKAKYGRWQDGPDDENYLLVYGSVLSMGDFGRYVIESGVHHFSCYRTGQHYPDRESYRSPRFVKSRWKNFVASLRQDQKAALADWLNDPDPHTMSRLTFLRASVAARREGASAEHPLTKDQQDLLDAVWSYRKVPDERYPLDRAKRWVFRRTLSLGWTPKRFAEEDSTIGHGRGREGHKAERWGKKYQWMAYHELLARLADNYQSSRFYSEEPYEGLHQIIAEREIDPSLPPVDFRTFNQGDGADAVTWAPPPIRLAEWPPGAIDFRPYCGDVQRLLADTATEPTIAKSVILSDTDQREWVVLESLIEKVDPAAHHGRSGLQEISFVHTLLVGAAEANDVLAALREEEERNSILDLVDTHGHVDCCYVGEVGRAGPTCYNRHAGFGTVEVAGRQFTAGPTVEPYTWEGNIFDCSIEENARALLPSTLMQHAVDLTFDMQGPSWLDINGSPLFVYYQEKGADSRALLVSGPYLRKYLAEHHLELVVLHKFERMELTSNHDGPFPSITVTAEARLTAGLALQGGNARREERDLDPPR